MKFHHVSTVCSSQEYADKFYAGIMGLEKIKTSILSKELAEQIFGHARRFQIILFGNEKFKVEVFVDPHYSNDTRPFEHICFEVKNRDEFLNRCQTNDLEVKRIPKGDSMLVFVEDFDGNLFEIKKMETEP